MTNELYVMFAVVAVVGLLLCILGIMLFNYIQTSEKRMDSIIKEIHQSSTKIDFLNIDINAVKEVILDQRRDHKDHIDDIVKHVNKQSRDYKNHFTEIEKTYAEIAKSVNLYVSDFTDSNNNTKLLLKGMNDHICALASQLRETRGVNYNIELGVSETIDRLEEVREILIDTHEIFDSNHKLMKVVTKGTAKTLVKLDKIYDDVEKGTGANFANVMQLHDAVVNNTNKHNSLDTLLSNLNVKTSDLINFVIESDKDRHKQIEQLSEDVDNVKILNLENHNGGLELIGTMNDLVISTIKDHTEAIINRVNSLDVTICGEFVTQHGTDLDMARNTRDTFIESFAKFSKSFVTNIVDVERNVIEVVNKSTKINEHKMIEVSEMYMNEFKTFATDNKVDIQNHALELNTKTNNLMQNSFVKDILNRINEFANSMGLIVEEEANVSGSIMGGINLIIHKIDHLNVKDGEKYDVNIPIVTPKKMTMWGYEDAENAAIEKAFDTPSCCKDYKSCTCATDFAGMYDETSDEGNISKDNTFSSEVFKDRADKISDKHKMSIDVNNEKVLDIGENFRDPSESDKSISQPLEEDRLDIHRKESIAYNTQIIEYAAKNVYMYCRSLSLATRSDLIMKLFATFYDHNSIDSIKYPITINLNNTVDYRYIDITLENGVINVTDASTKDKDDQTTYDPNKDDEANTDDVAVVPVGDDGISENTPYEALQAIMPNYEQVTPENKESVANERKRGKNGRFTKSVDDYTDLF